MLGSLENLLPSKSSKHPILAETMGNSDSEQLQGSGQLRQEALQRLLGPGNVFFMGVPVNGDSPTLSFGCPRRNVETELALDGCLTSLKMDMIFIW